MKNVLNEQTKFDSKEAKSHSSRCFGCFLEKEDAIESVRRNSCDMWETMYEYIVIEKIEQGIHTFAEVVGWFKYNAEKMNMSLLKLGEQDLAITLLGESGQESNR